MRAKMKSIAAVAVLAACSTYAVELFSVDFESDTVGNNPAADYVSPGTATADNFVTVVGSTTNAAGTGNGVELYDNSAGAGSRLAYDFSAGKSAIRFDISLARLFAGAAGKSFAISVLANGASPSSSGNRYAEVRVFDNGNIRYYSNGAYPSGTGKTDYLVVGTAATLTMYVNDADAAITGYQIGHDLAANSVDFWLDGTYWGTGDLRASLSDGTTNALGRVAIASGSSDISLDYVFDDIVVSTVTEPTYLVDDDYEADAVGTKPASANDVSPSTPAADYAVVVVGGSTNIAGTGNAVRLLDDNPTKGARLGYDMVASAPAQLSAARIDFSFAALSTTNSGDRFSVAIGEYGMSQSSSSARFLDCRLYADGTIDFRSELGPDSKNNALLASNNTLSIFVNDYDAENVTYIGPDSSTNILRPNSVTYWLNGSLNIETLLEDRTTANGGTLTSTNNIGRFGISAGSADYGLDFVIDDLKISELSLSDAPPAPDYLFYEPFEGQSVGAQPTGAAKIKPSANSPSNLVEVVDGSVNIAGTGNGVRYFSNDPNEGGALVWAFASNTNTQLSAVRVDLALAPLATDSTNLTQDIRISLGEYDNTLAGHSGRYINCRVYGNGKIGFDPRVGGAGDTGVTNAVDLLASNNTLTIIVNDYDTQSVDYTGLDAATYELPANSVAYWLNGNLQTFSGNEFTSMDLDDPTKGGTVGTTENNLGRFGFTTATTFIELDYVFDDILITTNLLVVIDGYSDWLELFPELGTSTNLMDDVEPDGMNNLLEYALGGNPTVNDAATILPGSTTSSETGTNWLNYVYNRRVDEVLTYEVLSSLDLVFGPITNATEEAGVSEPSEGFESATNRVPTDTKNQQFMQLKVQYGN